MQARFQALLDEESSEVFGHVTLEVECLDRLYLNGYIGPLATSGGLVTFMREQLGKPIPSPVVLGQVTASPQSFWSSSESKCPVRKYMRSDPRSGPRGDRRWAAFVRRLLPGKEALSDGHIFCGSHPFLYTEEGCSTLQDVESSRWSGFKLPAPAN